MKRTLLLLTLIFSVVELQAQIVQKDSTQIPELKWKLNASGSNYIKANVVGQMWLRYAELNPGSKIGNSIEDHYFDIGMRRLRFSVFGQLTNRLYFYSQFGQNNYNFLSPRFTGAFFHDAVVEYNLHKSIQLGTGLTGWSGFARFASPSVGSVLGVDVPLYQQTTNGTTDQFLRKLSIYGKGQLGKLDYRLAISSPMVAQNSTVPNPAIGKYSSFNLNAPHLQTQAYLAWQFLDKENNTNPYTTGTYLGKKKVVNLGLGFIHQQKAMWHLNTSMDTIETAMLLANMDLFVDLPIGKKGAAISSYTALSYSDLGPGYLRNIGAMNNASSSVDPSYLNGGGVGAPIIGTGVTIYSQLGYKLKDDLFKDHGTLLPYVSVQFSNYDRIQEPLLFFDGGCSWLIHGNHSGKLTLGWQYRPIYKAGWLKYELQTWKSNWILQYQISL